MAPAAEPPADLVGQRIDEYEILSRLGGGGMGVVYEAKSDKGLRVAIKTLKPTFANDKELVGRFLGESRALKAISHRAMVHILSIGELGDGTHYMVMEFLEGKSFEEVIKHGAPLDVREVMTWMVEVLDALEAVHTAGIIHRDLKPTNLFLARNGGIGAQVKIIDFGIAKHIGASGKEAPKTLVSAIVGTPDYMSPEQVNGADVTPASDLYALGCVMFEMLTGKLPFEEESSVKKMLMHVERPAPRVSSIVKSVPKGIDDLVAWTLHKDPAQRPRTARALKERIQEVMNFSLGSGSGPVPTRELKAVSDEAFTETYPITEPAVVTVKVQIPASNPRDKRVTAKLKQIKVQVPLWALAAAAAVLLSGSFYLLYTLTRPSELPPPIVTEPSVTGSEIEQPMVNPPPDRPIPKRKKPTAPVRKKVAGTKRR